MQSTSNSEYHSKSLLFLMCLLFRIHGSGTPFGDALELEGLSLAMEELGNQNHRFVVGSTKGNIGNTQVSGRFRIS